MIANKGTPASKQPPPLISHTAQYQVSWTTITVVETTRHVPPHRATPRPLLHPVLLRRQFYLQSENFQRAMGPNSIPDDWLDPGDESQQRRRCCVLILKGRYPWIRRSWTNFLGRQLPAEGFLGWRDKTYGEGHEVLDLSQIEPLLLGHTMAWGTIEDFRRHAVQDISLSRPVATLAIPMVAWTVSFHGLRHEFLPLSVVPLIRFMTCHISHASLDMVMILAFLYLFRVRRVGRFVSLMVEKDICCVEMPWGT